PASVRGRVLVLGLERVGERLDRGEERALETLEVARVRERQARLVREAAEQPQLAVAELLVADGRDDAAAARALDRQRREGEHGIVRTRRRVDALVLVRAEDERLPPLAEPLRRLRGEAPLLGELLLLLRVAAERARDETALSVLEPNRRTRGADDAGRARDDALQDLVLALRRRELATAEGQDEIDRKSTRLNSSHVAISYAVFCLKKKNTTNRGHRVDVT